MAASATEELTEPTEFHSTPTLTDIRGILQSIQNSMNKLEIDLAELKSSFKMQETKLKNTQESLKDVFESNKQLRIELQVTKDQVKKMNISMICMIVLMRWNNIQERTPWKF